MSQEKRFEIVHEDKNTWGMDGARILRDRETGVCYLYYFYGQTGGLTTLLDKDGKPVTMSYSPQG